MTGLTMRAGDWVEVKSKEEILATLDKRGQLANMPFMPQMFDYCGRRMRVIKTAHKTCDTITGLANGRRLEETVHLEGTRCDGKAYGGCAAACLLFWKEEWLKPADGPAAGTAQSTTQNGAGANGAGASPAASGSGAGCTEADVAAGTLSPVDDGQGPTYVCQATELLRATEPLEWWDARQYLADYKSGNTSLVQLARGFAYAFSSNVIRFARVLRTGAAPFLISAYDWVQKVAGGTPFPRKKGKVPAGEKTPTLSLDLQPGELVRVKSYDDILKTLDARNKNRGLYFDAEHVPYCGGTFRVLSRVDRIVDEKTGKMLPMKMPSVILEGASCQACYSNRRMFCPRGIYPYWREIWLERITPAAVTVVSASATASASSSPSAAPPAGGAEPPPSPSARSLPIVSSP